MTVAIEAPAFTTVRRPQFDARFRATFLGFAGRCTEPLRRITDARLVTAVGEITDAWFEGRTIWLQLRSDDGASGRVGLDMSVALPVPPEDYAVGRRIQVRGVARTHRVLDHPYIAVRTLAAA
jgi:hypothetical protein